MKWSLVAFSVLSLAVSACNSSTDGSSASGGANVPTGSPTGSTDASGRRPRPSPIPTSTPTPTPTPAPSSTPSPSPTSSTTQALIFNGTGTSQSDTDALAAILQSHGVTYTIVTSAQLQAMSLATMSQYQLIIWPGGDSIIQQNNLDPNTRERVREAVVNSGVSFAGFCAGAFIAVGPKPPAGGTPAWGLSIANYNYVTEYLPLGAGQTQPIAAMVLLSFADGTSRDIVWWDSPFLPTIAGGTISKYPDGSAAMIQVQSGNGFVVLSGPHPEAPQSWRDEENLVDTDGLDTDIAWNLINAALTRSRLAAF